MRYKKIWKTLLIIVVIILVCIAGMIGSIYMMLQRDYDDFLDNDQASNVMIGYGGKEHTLVYDIMIYDYDRVKEHLEKGEELNWIVNSVEMSPLELAATLPKTEDVYKMSELLMKYGADVNFRDSHGANILFYILYDKYDCIEVSKEKLLEYYLKEGADKNITIKNIEKNDPDLKGSTTLLNYCKRKGFSRELQILEDTGYE